MSGAGALSGDGQDAGRCPLGADNIEPPQFYNVGGPLFVAKRRGRARDGVGEPAYGGPADPKASPPSPPLHGRASASGKRLRKLLLRRDCVGRQTRANASALAHEFNGLGIGDVHKRAHAMPNLYEKRSPAELSPENRRLRVYFVPNFGFYFHHIVDSFWSHTWGESKMAEEKKKSYPKIPRNNWFLLREKFKQRTPEKVSASYIASALSMGEASASANIIPPLRAFGLIDEAGKPTDLAYDWRDDKKYPEVCKTILEATYPSELRDLFHDESAETKDVENWFARSARVGQSAARAYAATYIMLMEADLSKAKEQTTKTAGNGSNIKVIKAVSKPNTKASTKRAVPHIPNTPLPEHGGEPEQHKRGFSPKLHVDIQIHISPDSSPEQIDRIFESMAKHLPFKS